MTSRFKILAKGLRRKRGEMNKTETEYSEILENDPDVHQWWFEPMSVRLSHPPEGQPATYSPDFLVLMVDGTTFIDDVKAAFRDRAGDVRVKAAAELFPLWRWRMVIKQRKKDGGGFVIKEV